MGRSAVTLVSVLLMLVLGVPMASLVAPAEVSLAAESGDFSYAIIENGTEVEIIGYTGSQVNVTIPNSIEGRPVTSIGDSAFKNCSTMTNVTIPSTVRRIGPEAFARTGLVEIDIPDGVTSIGDLAFERCYYLSSVALGENLTTIGMGAFQTCPCLTVISLPENLTSIGPYAFLYCTSLNFFHVAEGNPDFNASEDGVLYSKDGSVLVQFPIGRQISMRVPEGVTSIGEGAFSTALYLSQVTFSKTVASIGSCALADCPKLYGLWFEGDAPACGEGWADGHDSTLKVFYNLDAAGFTTPEWNGLPSEPTDILVEFPYETINNDTEIRLTSYNGLGGEVMIPSTIEGLPVTEIGANAFRFTSNVISVFVPASVRYIGLGALSDVYTMNAIVVDPQNANYVSIDGMLYDENMTHLVQCPQGMKDSTVVPEGIMKIDPGAFHNCYFLSEIGLPEGLVTIGEYAFEGCSGLTSMKIPESVHEIGLGAFRGCFSLGSVNIPGNITTIQSETFEGCSALVSIDIPDNVELIGWDAFAYNNLETVHIAREGVVIELGAFEYCGMLREVSMAPSVIDDYAFQDCYSLTSLNLSAAGGLRYIGNQTFWGCSSLMQVDLRAFDALEYLGDYAFGVCRALTNLSLPDGIMMGSGVFYGCTALREVVMPDMEMVQNLTFDQCYELSSVTMPRNCSAIGYRAFQNCISLESVIISGNVSHIGYGVFSGCTNLTAIYFEGDAPECEGDWIEETNESLVIYHREGAAGFNTTAWEKMTVEIWVEDDRTGEGNDGLFQLMIVAISAVVITAVVFMVMRRSKR